MTEIASKPESALDQALEQVRKNPSEAPFFYDSFLNSDLYVPVQIAGASEGQGRPVGWDESFHPLYLKIEDTRVVPVFDSWERLKAWSAPKSPDYLYLRCHVLLGILAQDVAAVLNLATSWNHFFPPDILDRLRNAMKPVKPS